MVDGKEKEGGGSGQMKLFLVIIIAFIVLWLGLCLRAQYGEYRRLYFSVDRKKGRHQL